jgi:probable F420-dependent oxidoreductase
MAAIVEPGSLIWGMQLPIQTLTRSLREPWEDHASVADLVEVAQRAEATGHGFVGVCDHVAIPDDDYARHMTTTWYDPVATLAYLAAATTSVRLLSVVWIAAYRHPLLTAKSFATLDHLSGGRVVLGVGAGHVAGEFAALGVDFASRGELLDEAIDGVRAALGAGTYSTFAGPTVSWADAGVGPKPAQAELPVWVGGNSAPAFRRVGARGDGWIPMGNPLEQYPSILDTIRRSAAAAGREDTTFDIGYMPPWLYVGDPGDFELPEWCLTGSGERIAEALLAARAAGANVLHLKFRNRSKAELLDQLDAFAADVVPHLR